MGVESAELFRLNSDRFVEGQKATPNFLLLSHGWDWQWNLGKVFEIET